MLVCYCIIFKVVKIVTIFIVIVLYCISHVDIFNIINV